MEHIKQPSGSKICGQCCLAMVSGKTLRQAQKEMVRRRRGGTQPVDLIQSLEKWGVKCRAGYVLDPDSVAIIAVRSPEIASSEWGGHWMVWNKGQILDPASDLWNLDEFHKKLQITQVITILEGGAT